MEEFFNEMIRMVVLYSPRIITPILVLIIGYIVIKLIMRLITKLFIKKDLNIGLHSFLKSIINITLQVLLWISALGMIGIQMTSFIAILGAAGLAIGLALSGTLQNFASGVMILAFRPFKVGDFIEAHGVAGVVKEIQILNTILNTGDKKTIIIPNAQLSNNMVTNYSAEPQRRVDWTFGIGYGDSVAKAEEVLNKLIQQDDRILKVPAHFIAVSGLGDSSVDLVVRAWVNAADYWGVFFDMNRNVYQEFSKAGLNIPFPQMDVHLHQQ